MKLRPLTPGLLAAGIAATLLAACGGKDPGTAADGKAAAGEEKVLNVYNYSDYIAEDTIPNFEQQSGIRVTYDVYDSDEVLETNSEDFVRQFVQKGGQ